MKVKLTGHVVYVKYPWQEEGSYALFASKVTGADPSITDVGVSVDVEVEIPKEFNPTAMQLNALYKKKQELIKKFDETVAQVNEQISKLQAIEFKS